ncbi:putative GPI-anchored protein pfl2 [Pararge aegeria]|uniref:Jg16433 protein n=2 Tax=Pararge aegeria TaxID=116150 RepID=A0A8S4SJJ2_9NEOP|nr:putative GPI-anchored protein pfl2 [Pararge aegeria]XP_039758236.1 putative GPI-anchored protein pfl2 [Pararge aegeria]CAH2269407.1 jg16433 [Pararge aegeria aegeria]
MESPVRICIGAALVVNLLLITSTTVTADTLPIETTSTTLRNERNPRYAKTNGTSWVEKTKSKVPDAALNELNPKDSSSEEDTDKNAKYKDRGRVKYNLQSKTPTASPLKRVTKATDVVIVTPTPEVRKPAQIIDSMRQFKKTKIPAVTIISSTEPTKPAIQHDDEYDDEEEDLDSFEKFTSTKFDDSSFFTIPSFDDDDDYSTRKYKHGSNRHNKHDYITPTFSSFSDFFPKSVYSMNHEESYNSESYIDFDSELTTPKNKFFDTKHKQISSSIVNKVDTVETNMTASNEMDVDDMKKDNMGFDKLSNSSLPSNKSTVFIKNTKEIRYVDNDEEGTANKGQSDVHGTSIYYEMTVLSTETYTNIDKDSNDDDCDQNEPSRTTVSTSLNEELASIEAVKPYFVESSTKPSVLDSEPSPVSISTVSSNFFPSSTPFTVYTSVGPMPLSTQNIISSTDTAKIYPNSYSRNRNYSKRLNLSGTKDSPNSVLSTLQTDQVSPNQAYRLQTRRFHFTTPKSKPIWMAPRRNATKRIPTTIYSEHFDIKDKISSTHKPKLPTRTVLTTQSSEQIDPVLQSDVSSSQKTVYSPSISDNTIPSLWKRGSVKFGTSTASSAERNTESGISDLEIPPTLTAWALASMRSPPSLSSPTVNATGLNQKNVDENELQKVGELVDKKETTTISSMTSSTLAVSDYLTKNISEIYQNRLPWKPLSPTSASVETNDKPGETNSERVPAESNISIQSSQEPPSNEPIKTKSTESSLNDLKHSWFPVTNAHNQVTVNEIKETSDMKVIPPVDTIKSTGFESITKLPAEITTPTDDTVAPSEEKKETTTDYEITTIRFSYVPTEESIENTAPVENTDWHPVFPTRTRTTTEGQNEITTYRPKYVTTTELYEETTATIIESTPQVEVTSQIVENSSQKERFVTTVMPITTTTSTTLPKINTPTTMTKVLSTTELEEETSEPTSESTTYITTSIENSTEIHTKTKAELEATTPMETSTIIVTVATEINSERAPVTYIHNEVTESFEVETSKSSEENSNSNEVVDEKTKVPQTTTEGITKIERVVTTIEVRYPTTSARTTTEAETTTHKEDEIETTTYEDTIDETTKSVNDLEDLTSYAEDVTTEASSRVLEQEAGTGAAIAIAVSTIGVIALVLLVGLLLVVRRRGRRGVYAQRCTPVSLDAYSLDSVSVGHRKGNHRLRASKRSYGNPAYDDEVTSHPMQYPALANFALDLDSITAEFSEIPSVSVRPDEVPPGCEDKNRYSNVLPLPETRVPLRRIGNDLTTEYINANYVTGPGNIRNYYIACQAPLHNTVVDFWRMIWEQNSRVLVMLTEYMENGVEKCYEYLPPSEISDNRRTFGEFQIILKKREQRDKYAISSIQLINLMTRTWREVTQLWYFWPAKGVPEDYDSIIDFLSEMRSYMKVSQTAKEYDEEGVEVIYQDQSRSSYHNLSKLRSDENGSSNGINVYSPAKAEEMMKRGTTTNGTLGRMKAASEIEGVRPCVMVCASGAGRSAAMIAADLCARALASGQADVPRIVRRLRDQRPHSLSNRHHYIFLYKLLSEYGNRLMGGGVDTI